MKTYDPNLLNQELGSYTAFSCEINEIAPILQSLGGQIEMQRNYAPAVRFTHCKLYFSPNGLEKKDIALVIFELPIKRRALKKVISIEIAKLKSAGELTLGGSLKAHLHKPVKGTITCTERLW